MRAKKEYSIKAEAHLKAFTKSFTTLKKQLKNIDPTVAPLQSHKIHQAIFELPNLAIFGEEEYIGSLHFNNYLDLVALANGASNQQQSDHYFTLAFEQLTLAQSCYERAKLSPAKLAHYTAAIDKEKSAFTIPVIENAESLASADESLASADESLASADESLASADESLESVDESLESADESLESADESLESADESLESADKLLPVEQKKRASSIAENNTTFFYVDTVPLKKRQKFENDTLSVIRKIKKEECVESSAVSKIGI